MITINLRDPADLALIRRGLMNLHRMDETCKEDVFDLLMLLDEQDENRRLPRVFFLTMEYFTKIKIEISESG